MSNPWQAVPARHAGILVSMLVELTCSFFMSCPFMLGSASASSCRLFRSSSSKVLCEGTTNKLRWVPFTMAQADS